MTIQCIYTRRELLNVKKRIVRLSSQHVSLVHSVNVRNAGYLKFYHTNVSSLSRSNTIKQLKTTYTISVTTNVVSFTPWHTGHVYRVWQRTELRLYQLSPFCIEAFKACMCMYISVQSVCFIYLFPACLFSSYV